MFVTSACSSGCTSASNVWSTMALILSFLGVPVPAIGAGGGATAAGAAATIPGLSGVAPTRLKQTLRKISRRARSIGVRSTGRGGPTPPSAGTNPRVLATMVSHVWRGTNTMSLMNPGLPNWLLSPFLTSADTPAQLNASSKVVIKLSSASVGSMAECRSLPQRY